MVVAMPPWLLLLAGAAVTYTVLRRVTTLDLFKIPTPWGLPWVGQLIQLAQCTNTPHEQFLKWHETLGSIVRLRIFHRDVILIADPQVAAQVLAKGPNECYRRAPEYVTYDAAHGMPGCHAIMTEHNEERWRTIRKGIAPAYSMVAIRDNFPAIVRCYAHVCQRIADGTAWLEPPAAAASILPAGSRPPSDAAAAAQPAAADAAASKQPGGSKPLSRSSSIELSRQGLSRSGSIELSRQNLSRTCSIDALNPLGMSAAAAAGRAVCIDEEIFGATTQILAEGFLRIPANQLLDVDYQQTASDVSGLIAITNSFLSQPWKKWLYLGIPNLCEESRTFHAQRNRLMALTNTLATHVEQHRKISSGSSSRAPTDAAPAGSGFNAAAAAAGSSGSDGGGDAVAAVHTSGLDCSLVGCLSQLREPDTGKLFSHQALQAELFLETVGQESIPWTMSWTLFLLSQNPKAEAAVLQELRSVGVPCNGDPTAAAAVLSLDLLKQLPYCTAVLQEAMRMFPAGVMAASRMTHQPTQIGPYQVPAGTIVFPCLYSILMYSGNWDEPTKFKPERWLAPQYATDPTTGATRFVPFGIGPKACVAQQLAYVQLKVLMVLLLSTFSWQLAPCMGGPEGVLSSTQAALELRVDKGMWMVPTPRKA